MGQMVMVDEDELRELERRASYFNVYYDMIKDIGDECYPDILYWLDIGSNAQCNIVILDKTKRDLMKYRRRAIKRSQS